MRNIFIVLALGSLLVGRTLSSKTKSFPPSNLPPAKLNSLEERWDNAMLYRMKLIEKNSGIKFEDGWVPRMQFGRPHYISNQSDFSGCYDQESRSFWFTSAYKILCFVPTSMDSMDHLSETLKMLFDHELGHALSEQISYRRNGFIWPDTSIWRNQNNYERIGVKVLSEGIGEYFKYLTDKNFVTSSEYLPDGPESYVWRESDWTYDGGHFVVKPIIDKFGEEGIVYITTHNLLFKDADVRTAAIEYQKEALRVLSEKN